MKATPALPPDDLELVFRACVPLWPRLRRARIFVTGATGFFGRWLLESLVMADSRLGLEIHFFALSRDPAAFLRQAPHLDNPRKITWLAGSVCSLDSSLLRGEKIDFVIHLATEGDTAATLREPLAAIDVITGGTQRALAVALATGARRFLFTSSGSVYGRLNLADGPVAEEFAGGSDVTDMTAVYAISGEAKRHAELLCAATTRQHGLETVIARCFAFAGPGLPLDGKFAFGNFLRDALNGQPIVITGDGTPIRSYLHAADLTVWLWNLLLRGTSGRAYNVGSDEPINLRDLAVRIAGQVGGTEVRVLQSAQLGAVPHYYVPSILRAKAELGLDVQIGLDDAIKRTAAWSRAQADTLL